MAKLVTGLFNTRSGAMLAIEDLMRHGLAQDDLSMLNTDTTLGREFFTDIGTKAPEGGVIGVIVGGILGGIIAALMRLGHVPFPGVDMSAVSLLMVTLDGIALLGTIGLIIGLFIGASIPEYEENLYRADTRHGGILLGVYTHARREGEVRRLMEAAGGRDIRVKNVRDEALPARTREHVPAGERER
jgi:hypothetical protein